MPRISNVHRPDPEIAQRNHASAPKTAYAINAMAKRLMIPAAQLLLPHFCCTTRTTKWCTGKDSNLRTSLGGTDLQSVGFNHSPTCAKTRRAMQSSRFVQQTSRAAHSQASPHRTFTQPSFRKLVFANPIFAKQGNQGSRLRIYCAKITTRRKSSEWSALEKPVAPLLPSPPPAGNSSNSSNSFPGAGEGI